MYNFRMFMGFLVGLAVIDIFRGESAFFYLSGDLAWIMIFSIITSFVNFTLVEEGTNKIVTFLKAYNKTLLQKRGYLVNRDGEIVDVRKKDEKSEKTYNLVADSSFTIGGLRWIGWWPFFTIYKTSLDYIKMDQDGTAMVRHWDNVESFLARDYVYAVQVSNAEDKDGLPLYLLLSVTAFMSNSKKAVFDVQDWYSAFVRRLTTYIRGMIAKKSYGEIQAKNLEKEIMKELNDPTDDNDGGIIDEIRNIYGLTIRYIEVVDVNPGEKYREITLRQLEGRRIADQDVEETAGRILKSVSMMSGIPIEDVVDSDNNVTTEGLKTRLVKNSKLRGTAVSEGGLKEYYDYAQDQLKRDRAGVEDIRIGNTDGSSLSDAFATAAGISAMWNKFKGGSSGSKAKGPRKDSGKKTKKDQDWGPPPPGAGAT